MCWQDPDSIDKLIRAPILLFPTVLVRKPGQSSYELRLHGVSPEINIALQQLCKERYGITLPELSPDTPLTDWFAQLSEVIRTIEALSVELDMALGNSSINVEDRLLDGSYQLPDKPKHFD